MHEARACGPLWVRSAAKPAVAGVLQPPKGALGSADVQAVFTCVHWHVCIGSASVYTHSMIGMCALAYRCTQQGKQSLDTGLLGWSVLIGTHGTKWVVGCDALITL
jgi:hypothetical protein